MWLQVHKIHYFLYYSSLISEKTINTPPQLCIFELFSPVDVAGVGPGSVGGVEPEAVASVSIALSSGNVAGMEPVDVATGE